SWRPPAWRRASRSRWPRSRISCSPGSSASTRRSTTRGSCRCTCSASSRGRPVPDDRPAAVYGWSRYACWTVVALAYAAAGASKLRNGGLHWWDATNIRGIYYRTSLNPMHFDWRVSLRLVGLPDAVVEILGILSVALEVGFVAVLFSRMARRVLPLAMIGFHVVVFFLQNLLFLDLILLQSIFWERRGERAAPAPDARPGRAALVAAAAAVVCAAWLVRV